MVQSGSGHLIIPVRYFCNTVRSQCEQLFLKKFETLYEHQMPSPSAIDACRKRFKPSFTGLQTKLLQEQRSDSRSEIGMLVFRAASTTCQHTPASQSCPCVRLHWWIQHPRQQLPQSAIARARRFSLLQEDPSYTSVCHLCSQNRKLLCDHSQTGSRHHQTGSTWPPFLQPLARLWRQTIQSFVLQWIMVSIRCMGVVAAWMLAAGMLAWNSCTEFLQRAHAMV